MDRTKTTLYVETELLLAAKVEAARAGRHECEIFEEALRSYLGTQAVARAWRESNLSEEEALQLACDEIHEART